MTTAKQSIMLQEEGAIDDDIVMQYRQMILFPFLMVFTLGFAGCSSAWSDAEASSVQGYCSAAAGEHADSCASWIDGISRLSNCDPDQAKRVIDRIVAEYNGVPALSVAENYQLVGCEYGAR